MLPANLQQVILFPDCSLLGGSFFLVVVLCSTAVISKFFDHLSMWIFVEGMEMKMPRSASHIENKREREKKSKRKKRTGFQSLFSSIHIVLLILVLFLSFYWIYLFSGRCIMSWNRISEGIKLFIWSQWERR